MKIKQIRIITTLVLCILTQTTYAQKTQTMLQKENLKGKVKSVRVTNENADYIKVWFDKTGKITKKEESWDDMRVWNNYVYDNEGRLISVCIFYPAFKDTPLYKHEVTYKYRNDGVRESYGDGTDKSQYSYQYDDRGNCILEIFHKYDDEYKYKERIYNEKNQLVEAFSHNGQERCNIWKTDSTGRTYEETEWTEPMKKNHVFFEYNKFGDVSLVTLKTGENGYIALDKKGTITYKRYDKSGNWLEQIFPADLTPDGYTNYDIVDNYNNYYEINETHIGGQHIKRIIEYYE